MIWVKIIILISMTMSLQIMGIVVRIYDKGDNRKIFFFQSKHEEKHKMSNTFYRGVDCI